MKTPKTMLELPKDFPYQLSQSNTKGYCNSKHLNLQTFLANKPTRHSPFAHPTHFQDGNSLYERLLLPLHTQALHMQNWVAD